MSKGSIIFITVSTFIVGVLTGFYVYFFTGGPAKYGWDIEPTKPAYVITVEEYGACERQRSCGSYRIDATGTFTGLLLQNGTSERIDKTVSGSTKDRIEQAIRSANLNEITALGAARCGVAKHAYVASLEINTTAYTFHVCGQEPDEPELLAILREYMEFVH